VRRWVSPGPRPTDRARLIHPATAPYRPGTPGPQPRPSAVCIRSGVAQTDRNVAEPPSFQEGLDSGPLVMAAIGNEYLGPTVSATPGVRFDGHLIWCDRPNRCDQIGVLI
jgi:hypothetical protein